MFLGRPRICNASISAIGWYAKLLLQLRDISICGQGLLVRIKRLLQLVADERCCQADEKHLLW